MVLQSPKGLPITQAVKLSFSISNNEVKYEVVLLGLRVARALFVTSLKLQCDSQLTASHIQGEYEAKNERMAQYLTLMHSLNARFTKFVVTQVLRLENK